MKISFYTVNTGYCDYLRQFDPCVPYTMDKKAIRPFVGIVFEVDGFHYYAPLTSPKPKHGTMKNDVDFLKINGGLWGAINFNNMIPVPQRYLEKVKVEHLVTDTPEDTAYKNLLENQLSWCASNKALIFKKGEKLYHMIVNGKARDALAKRCCKFLLLEKALQGYRPSPKMTVPKQIEKDDEFEI